LNESIVTASKMDLSSFRLFYSSLAFYLWRSRLSYICISCKVFSVY